MGEEEDKPGASGQAAVVYPVGAGFPPASLPTVYADGVLNLSPTQLVAKFYLFRTDPDTAGKAEYKNQVVAQVSMPVAGFLQMASFFEKAVKRYTETGVFSKELVASIRKLEGLDQ